MLWWKGANNAIVAWRIVAEICISYLENSTHVCLLNINMFESLFLNAACGREF